MSGLAGEWRARAREQFEVLLDGVADARERERDQARVSELSTARDHFAESLNQGLRRVRQTADVAELAALALELTAPFAKRSAFFLFNEGRATADFARGLGTVPIHVAPEHAAAFRAAIDTHDPVIAAGTPAEISIEIAERLGIESSGRIYLFPLAVRGDVRAILFATEDVQPAPLELVAGLAALQMEALTPAPAPKVDGLVSIQGTLNASTTAVKWTELPPEQQALHLKAQRTARLRVAEIRIEHGDGLRRGLERSNVYELLREPIDRARDAYRRDFLQSAPTMVDYLYLELVRGLARNDDRLLGPDFPGPLV